MMSFCNLKAWSCVSFLPERFLAIRLGLVVAPHISVPFDLANSDSSLYSFGSPESRRSFVIDVY